MTAELRAPVAIRITRPYATEDDYLDHELDTLTRASITLVGAQPRAEGVVLRFELVLTSGQVLLRGEGRVIGFKPNALQGIGGLALRFTRLDTRSKALVDKAAALRERRRPSFRSPDSDPPDLPSIVPARASTPSIPPAAVTQPSGTPVAPAAPSAPAMQPLSAPLSPDLGVDRGVTGPSPSPPSPPSPPPPPPSASTAAGPPTAAPTGPGADPMARPPADREALLERLRARARTLDPTMVGRLLASRGSS